MPLIACPPALTAGRRSDVYHREMLNQALRTERKWRCSAAVLCLLPVLWGLHTLSLVKESHSAHWAVSVPIMIAASVHDWQGSLPTAPGFSQSLPHLPHRSRGSWLMNQWTRFPSWHPLLIIIDTRAQELKMSRTMAFPLQWITCKCSTGTKMIRRMSQLWPYDRIYQTERPWRKERVIMGSGSDFDLKLIL